MLKKKHQLFEVLFAIADLVVVSLAWLIAYWCRFSLDLIPIEKGIPDIKHYYTMLIYIWIIWFFVFRKMGLYRAMRGVRPIREMWRLINANFLGVLLLIAATYLIMEKRVPFSRMVFVYFLVLASSMTMIARTILRATLREIRRRGYNLRYMLLVGSGAVAGDIASRVRENNELGIQMVGCLSKDGKESEGAGGVPIIGSYADLSNVLSTMDLDQVVVALPLEDNIYLPQIMETTHQCLADVKIVPDLYKFISLGGSIDEFEGLPVISVQESPLEGFNLKIKRVFDLFFASFGLLLLSPFLILIALLVKATSRGPVFYRQERVSYDGTPFKIYKFRTMRIDAESKGPGWTTKDDPRVTPIGQFLRSTSIDEFPQLINVIKGDMSLVGPRPERPVFIQEFRKKIPLYYLRHKVPAGMTGWAQVNGWRGDTSIDKRIECDLFYIENWTLLFDLKILFLTVFKGFRNKNAY